MLLDMHAIDLILETGIFHIHYIIGYRTDEAMMLIWVL